jgi:hypothetical protein
VPTILETGLPSDDLPADALAAERDWPSHALPLLLSILVVPGLPISIALDSTFPICSPARAVSDLVQPAGFCKGHIFFKAVLCVSLDLKDATTNTQFP